MHEWKDMDTNTFYFFRKEDGLIVGQVYNLAHTKIWGAKIPVNAREEDILGQYINIDFAKKAVEKYWDVQSRTLIE